MIVLAENHDDDKVKGRPPAPSELFIDPPPLYLPDGDPSTSHNKPLPRIPPPPQITSSNHLDIVRSEVAIKGSWTIDTSQPQIARSSSEPRPGSSSLTKPNLRLLTRQGGIEATIKVKGERRAIIEATSYDGSVALNLVGREETPFYAHLTSFNGDVLVRLPHSFYGPIKCRSRRVESGLTLNNGHAPPIFSPSMQLQLVALSSIEETDSQFESYSFFLGDLTTHPQSQQDESLWTADEVLVELDCRDRAYFFWAEESTDMVVEENSVLETMLTRLKPLHEVLVKPWTARSRRRESTE